jgi:hypothetical protein
VNSKIDNINFNEQRKSILYIPNFLNLLSLETYFLKKKGINAGREKNLINKGHFLDKKAFLSSE